MTTAIAPSDEYLTFKIGAEEYGIDILLAQEIRSYEPPTHIMNAPAFLKGVVHLRGVIVPIIDLRLKLGYASAEYNHFTVMIVLNLGNRVVGAVVDSVSDVLMFTSDTISPAPSTNTRIDSSCVIGIGSVDGRTVTLLDAVNLLAGDYEAFHPAMSWPTTSKGFS